MILLTNNDRSRFFLVPSPEAIAPGELELASMTGGRFRLDEEAVSAFQVPEAVAKAYAEQTAASIMGELSGVQRQVGEAMKQARAQIEGASLLKGVDLDDPQQLKDMEGLARELADVLPGATQNQALMKDLLRTLERLDVGGKTPLEALTEEAAAAQPDADLSKAVAELAELQAQLDAMSLDD